MSTRDKIVKTLQILSNHPLVRTIPPQHIRDWIIATYKVEPDRLEWHARRTMTIGGSEIFTAVAFYRAVKAAAVNEHYSAYLMTSVQDLVKAKLLRSAPAPADSHMRRGILSEPLARQVYISKLRKLGFDVASDTKASSALKGLKLSNAPWLAYNEDDILLINGIRVLVDYKCPAPDPVTGLDFSVEEAYKHQLHLGHVALELAGYPCQRMVLVKYNVVEADTVEIEVPFSQQICDENLVAGGYLYKNYVLQNRLPEYQPQLTTRITLHDLKEALDNKVGEVPGAPEVALAQIRSLAAQFALAKGLSSASAKLANNINEQIKRWINQIDRPAEQSQVTLSIGAVEVKTQDATIIDEDRLLRLATSKGLVLDDFAIPKYDLDKLMTAVQAISNSEELSTCITEQSTVNVGVTRKTTGAAADVKNLYISVAEQSLTNVLSVVGNSSEDHETLDDIVALDVSKQNAMQQYFARTWTQAVSTFKADESMSQLLLECSDVEGLTDLSPNPNSLSPTP